MGQERADFDTKPPVPVSEYEQIVRGVNVGYDLLFLLTHSFLRALRQQQMHLLIVGAGGGAEIERFLPTNSGWRITGVDPSAQMLAEAQAKADRLGLSERVRLVYGTVDDLQPEATFDAATCIFVLHFLSDPDKLTLLHGIASRLKADAPLIVGTAARFIQKDEYLRSDLLGTWQQHGELMDVPAERMSATIDQLLPVASSLGSAEDHVRLLHEAGFAHVGEALRVMDGAVCLWFARK
jgi:tRNA (cmo5U34)-methyltransferase